MPRSPYGHIVNPGSVSCRMPRKKYSVGKSSPAVMVKAPGFGSACAEAVAAAPNIVTPTSIATRNTPQVLVVTRTSAPPGGSPPAESRMWRAPVQEQRHDADRPFSAENGGLGPAPTSRRYPEFRHFCLSPQSIRQGCPLPRHAGCTVRCRPAQLDGTLDTRSDIFVCQTLITYICVSPLIVHAVGKWREIAHFDPHPTPPVGEPLAPGHHGPRRRSLHWREETMNA